MARDILIKSAEQIALARRSGKLAAEVLSMIEPFVVPGVSTEALDDLCRDFIVNVHDNIKPSFVAA